MALSIPDEAEAPTSRDQSRWYQTTVDALVAAFNRTGVVSGCEVTQRGAGANMSVDVAAGVIEAAGVRVTVGALNVAVTAAHATLPRIDVVVADTTTGVATVVAGTAGASVSTALIEPATGAGKVLLAQVLVPAAVTTIVTNYLSDRRAVLAITMQLVTLGLTKNYTSVFSAANQVDSVLTLNMSSKQAGSVSQRRSTISIGMADVSGTVEYTITGAANNGSGLIRLTMASTANLATGDQINVWAVGGTTEANAANWTITVVDATHLDLQASTFTNAYTSGGKLTNRTMMYGSTITLTPRFDRIDQATGAGVITGTAANGDDLNGVVLYNDDTYGRFSVTDGFYVGQATSFDATTTAAYWSAYTVAANMFYGIKFTNKAKILGGRAGAGLDFSDATFAASTPAIRLGNTDKIVSDNAADSADLTLIWATSGNLIGIGDVFTVSPTAGNMVLTATANPWIRVDADGIAGALQWRTFNSTAATPGEIQWRRARGTLAAPLRVKLGDSLGWINSRGYYAADDSSAGTSGSTSSEIRFLALEDYTSTAQGGGFYFGVSQIGATTVTEVARFDWPSAGLGKKRLLMADAANIGVGSTTGTIIAEASTDKLAFWGATPIVRPAAYTQTYSTASRTAAALTSATLTDNTAGTANTTLEALTSGTVYATDVAAIRNNFADLAAMVNKLTADVLNIKQVQVSIIDDHQAIGLAA